MEISGITFLHFLLLYQTLLTDEVVSVIGQLGESVVLSCLDRPVNKTPSMTRWTKDNLVLATRNHSLNDSVTHKQTRMSILDNSSLSITDLMGIDEAVYQCRTEPPSDTHHELQLQVTDGPKNMLVNVTTATPLANGTLFVVKGSTVVFSCSSVSYPAQELTWTFEDVKENKTRAFGNKSSLHFELINIQPEHQTNYSCFARNLVSKKTVTRTVELLVYYIPDIHPNCIWHHASRTDQVLFNCSLYGAYPNPTLTVVMDSQEDRTLKLNRSQETENFELTLNRSMLYEGQKITCVGNHLAQKPGDTKNCTFTLAAPYPMGQPMVAALEGTNITLTCTESRSLPPAISTWQRGVKQEPIVPSSKYIVSEEGPNLSLTIVNATKDDQGVYFCWSENVLTAKELEVYLTIRSSADKSGAMVGVFISFFILAAGITVGYFAYTHRDRICIGLRFGRLKDENMDVINLMESDEEDVFHHAVPRLPPLTNGHASAPATTLVEIHRVQSSECAAFASHYLGDNEDNVNDTDIDYHSEGHTQDHKLVHTQDHTLDQDGK